MLVNISKTPVKMLLIGFGPFPGISINPAGNIIDSLKAEGFGEKDIAYQILPAEYRKGETAISRIMGKYEPEHILMIGVNVGARILFIEKMAVNFTHSPVPDNSGTTRINTKIKNNGAAALWATIPVDRLLSHLRSKGFLCDIEAFGGSYVCNHLFYVMLYELNRRGMSTDCGFIHVPPDETLKKETGWPMELLKDSIKTSCDFLIST